MEKLSITCSSKNELVLTESNVWALQYNVYQIELRVFEIKAHR
jgi:hypothetical protein